jgi:hypothetical protein
MLTRYFRSRHAIAIALSVLTALAGSFPGAAFGSDSATTKRSREGAIPTALVGKWGFAVATGVYCNALGNCAPGSGGSISFTFKADGRTEYALFESALVDGCGEIQSLTLKTGTTAVKGAQLIFTPKAGTYKSVNGCRPDLTGTWAFEAKDLKLMPLGWRLVQDQQDPARSALQITDPAGEASGVYSRR